MTNTNTTITSPAAAGPSDETTISPFALLASLIVHRRLVVIALAIGTLGGGALGLLRFGTYTSAGTFLPSSPRSASGGLSGLAAQFGVALPAGDAPSIPTQVYADLLKSRDLLGHLLETRFSDPDSPEVKRSLVDLLEVKGGTPERRRDQGIRLLQRRVAASNNARTGVVSFSVTVRNPKLAHAIASRLLELVSTFNLEKRQSRASAERRFTAQRLADVQRDLRKTEEDLQGFLRRNRGGSTSPDLAFERGRLERAVTLQQQVYTSLAQSLEQAKIEEVRDTPVITLIEAPEVPVRRDPSGITLLSAVGAAVGLVTGILLVLAAEARNRARSTGSSDYLELRARWFEWREGRRSAGSPKSQSSA
jgi:uncharacterized protein involved in exopolysaccharide biosynthesis